MIFGSALQTHTRRKGSQLLGELQEKSSRHGNGSPLCLVLCTVSLRLVLRHVQELRGLNTTVVRGLNIKVVRELNTIVVKELKTAVVRELKQSGGEGVK